MGDIIGLDFRVIAVYFVLIALVSIAFFTHQMSQWNLHISTQLLSNN